jgi:hypothetical protein
MITSRVRNTEDLRVMTRQQAPVKDQLCHSDKVGMIADESGPWRWSAAHGECRKRNLWDGGLMQNACTAG